MDKNEFERLSGFQKVLVTIACFIHIAVWSVCKVAFGFAAFIIIGVVCVAPLYLVLKLVGVDTGINVTICAAVAIVAVFVIEGVVDAYMTDDEKKKYFG